MVENDQEWSTTKLPEWAHVVHCIDTLLDAEAKASRGKSLQSHFTRYAKILSDATLNASAEDLEHLCYACAYTDLLHARRTVPGNAKRGATPKFE